MRRIDPKEAGARAFYATLTETVAPRPIAFASTVNAAGKVNLSPFSFFNVFSSNPPILVFSPVRRGRDGTVKDTLNNVHDVKEVVINVVNHSMVEQVSLASAEYDSDINEFIKAGFTAIDSEIVKPPRVKEAPAQFECKVIDIIELGEEGGAGNLVICEVVLAHIQEDLFDEEGHINPHKIDLVSRMGQNYYCRATGDNVFIVEKPIGKICIGIDKIPENIRNSKVLTGNDLGKLGNVEQLPGKAEVAAMKEGLSTVFTQFGKDPNGLMKNIHEYAKELLDQGEVNEAWKVLLTQDSAD